MISETKNNNALQIYTKHLTIILIFIIFLLFVVTILLGSVPPVSRDALTHHLYIPKLYLKYGLLHEIPEIVFSYYPMNLDLLYMIPLFFGNDITQKYIHYSFAISTSFLIFKYLKKQFHINYALFGVIFFLSVPAILKLSISIYVDLGLTFFTTASLLLLLNWAHYGFHVRHLLLSGICCGLAIGTKYNGFVTLIILSLFIPVLYQKSNHPSQRSNTKAFVAMIIFFITSLLIVSPWLIRNFWWTGNPIFPLHDTLIQSFQVPHSSHDHRISITNDPLTNEENRINNTFIARRALYQETWWQSLLLPIRFFFEGQDDNPKYFDGKLTPFLLFLPFFAFFGQGKSRKNSIDKHTLLWFSVLFFFFTFFQQIMRIRYMVSIIPALTILSVFGLHSIISFIEKTFDARHRLVKMTCIALIPITVLTYNFNYLIKQFEHVDPLPFLSGRVDRDSYISQYRNEYPAIRFLNEQPGTKRTLAIFLGNRGYYFDDEVLFDLHNGNSYLCTITRNVDSDLQIAEVLISNGFSHILIRYDLFNQWIGHQLDRTQQMRLSNFLENETTLVFSENGHGVYQINHIGYR